MQNLLLNNWRAKLVCLILAFAIWYLIRINIGPMPEFPPSGLGTTQGVMKDL